MKSKFLDAVVDLTHLRDRGDEAIYLLQLEFVDPFGRNRKHQSDVSNKRSVAVQHRASFTALSSANAQVGVVEKVTDLEVHVLLLGDERMVIGNRHEPEFKMGDSIVVIERLDPMDTDRQMSFAVLPHPLPMAKEMLCLQSVNADVLDESGELLFRMSADPLFKGGCYDTRVAT